MRNLVILFRQASALTKASMKSRYRKTFAGFFWVMMNPLVTYAIQVIVFKNVLVLKLDNYHVFLLGGLLPWLYFVQTVDMTTSLFVNSSGLLKSGNIHPLVLVTAQVFDNSINFGFAFMLVLTGSYFLSGHLGFEVLLLPFPMIMLVAGTFSVSWISAILNVFYRDTRFLIAVILNVLFFATPIFYPESLLPSELRWITYVNPIYYWIKPIRVAVFGFDLDQFFYASLFSFLSVVFVAVIGVFIWRWKRNLIYIKL